jgi:phage FluMu protein Com
MGIRFSCHHCNFELHVKDFQGGKRGKCPECKGAFRIPLQDASHSIAIEEPPALSESAWASTSNQNVSEESKERLLSSNAQGTAVAQIPTAIAASLDTMWLVRPPSGGQFGPAPGALLWDWIQENRVTADSLLQREGTTTWQEARALIPEFFDASSKNGKNVLPPPKPGEAPTSTSDVEPASSVSSGLAAKRKAQKRRQQMTILIVLAVLSLLLLIALVVVLLSQSG